MQITKIKDILTVCQKANETLLIEGVHGIGKSEIVSEWCKDNNIHIETLFLSHQEVGDLIGMPRTVEKPIGSGEFVTIWTKPIWLQRLEEAAAEGKGTLVFLDELNRAPLDVRQSALQLVLERRIHQHSLPEINGIKTIIVAAVNPSDIYQADDLDSALLDRFCSVTVEPDVNAWLEYAKNKNINRIVQSYIRENPSKIFYMPNENSTEKISASPRSWTKLAELIDNFENIPDSLKIEIIKGKIGALASEFFLFMRKFNERIRLEDIEEIAFAAFNRTKKFNDSVDFVKDLCLNLEPIQKNEMAFNLIKKYAGNVNITTFEEAIPMFAFLYGIELELLATVLKSLGKSTKDEDKSIYLRIVQLDRNKELFKKLV